MMARFHPITSDEEAYDWTSDNLSQSFQKPSKARSLARDRK